MCTSIDLFVGRAISTNDWGNWEFIRSIANSRVHHPRFGDILQRSQWQQAMTCQSEIRTDLNYSVVFETRTGSHHNLAKDKSWQVHGMRSLSLLWFSKQKGMHPWKSIDKDNKKGAQIGPVSARHPRKKLLIGKEKCMPPNQNWQFFRGTGTILINFHSLIEIVMKFSRHKRLLIRKWHEMRHDNINAKHHPSHPTFSWFFRDGVVHFGNHPATGGIPLWHFLGPFQHGLCLCWASTKQSSSQPHCGVKNSSSANDWRQKQVEFWNCLLCTYTYMNIYE